MEKLLLRSRFTLGDVVLLTAAVRDLHWNWPGRYVTDVRTGFPELWEHNPHLTSLADYDASVRVLDCEMPLVEESDAAGRHALHGFLDFLSTRLGVRLGLSAFHGDIHLSATERNAPSPVTERCGQEVPYWLVNAGGKYDCTIKWWDPARYQSVVDHFHGRLQFVQVGRLEHRHAPLRGVIDLRGRTTGRELVRLVHHADGVVCGVTALMHLAAAVLRPTGRTGARPCVVIAGGREAPSWEAYPGHQFIHTVGALPCCASGGCWRSRTWPLGDGEEADRRLCVDVRGELPACMDLITADEVIRRIELYLAGGMARGLEAAEAARAMEAVAWSQRQPALPEPLTFHNAPRQAAEFISQIPTCPDGFAGRGIVICGGGARMFSNAWVCIRMLRKLGCALPIELWHLGPAEMDGTMAALVQPWGVTCRDATTDPAVRPAKVPGAWPLKPYAIINSSFAEVLLLDADNVPVRNPDFLFDHPWYLRDGAMLWPDLGRLRSDEPAWRLFDVAYRDEPEVESGQVLVHKERCWAPLLLCLWYNQHHHLFYRHVHGDKETFHFAFRRLNVPYAMIPHPPIEAEGALYQRAPDGERLFQHRNCAKWDLRGLNPELPNFRYEADCREFLRELAVEWDGRIEWLKAAQAAATDAVAKHNGAPLNFAVVLVSCRARDARRAETLQGLVQAGWPAESIEVTLDEGRFDDPVDRLTHTAWRALRTALERDADYVLLLEDDLEFNRHLVENLRRWGPLRRRELEIGGLCNLGARELAWDVPGAACLVHPHDILGSQAVLCSRRMLEHCLAHWFEAPPDLDLKLGALAGRLRQPFFFHYPSLVQHVGRASTLGHTWRPSLDYDPDWRTTSGPAIELVAASKAALAGKPVELLLR